jgi:hypothetical protein
MPLRCYLLDNNVVSYFFNAGLERELSRIAQALQLGVVREVHEEAARHPNKGHQYEQWQPSSALTVRDIVVGGAGSACLACLQTASGSLRDLGELASIALAFEDPSLVLVSNDKNAIWIAMRELHEPGERIIRFSTFLRRAHSFAGLTRAMASELAKHAQLVHAPPTWWSDWLATLPE